MCGIASRRKETKCDFALCGALLGSRRAGEPVGRAERSLPVKPHHLLRLEHLGLAADVEAVTDELGGHEARDDEIRVAGPVVRAIRIGGRLHGDVSARPAGRLPEVGLHRSDREGRRDACRRRAHREGVAGGRRRCRSDQRDCERHGERGPSPGVAHPADHARTRPTIVCASTNSFGKSVGTLASGMVVVSETSLLPRVTAMMSTTRRIVP